MRRCLLRHIFHSLFRPPFQYIVPQRIQSLLQINCIPFLELCQLWSFSASLVDFRNNNIIDVRYSAYHSWSIPYKFHVLHLNEPATTDFTCFLLSINASILIGLPLSAVYLRYSKCTDEPIIKSLQTRFCTQSLSTCAHGFCIYLSTGGFLYVSLQETSWCARRLVDFRLILPKFRHSHVKSTRNWRCGCS